jgi:hypothetical protein
MIKFIIIILVLIFIFKKTKTIENFSNYKSTCKKPIKLIEQVLKERNVKRNDKNYDLFVPCSYNRCEQIMKVMKNNNSKRKYYLVDYCDWINSKARLWALLWMKHGEKAEKYMPRTYLLKNLKDKIAFYTNHHNRKINNKKCMYILKNNKQRQRGLKLVDNIKDLKKEADKGYILVQEYYKDPYLIKGRKINFRYYLLIVCRDGKISGYIHKNGFVYYTPKFYKPNSLDFDRHITTGYIDRKIYETNPLTLEDFRKHLEKENHGSSKIWDKNVNNLMNKVLQALKLKVCTNKKFKKNVLFQVFGADVAPNSKLYPKLMEINKGPDLGAKDEKDKAVKLSMIRDMFHIIEPLTNDKKCEFTKIF